VGVYHEVWCGGKTPNFTYDSGMKSGDYFKGKRVTVMGLGLLGRGIGDARYIAEAGAALVLVTDLKSEAELATSVEQLREYPNVVFHLGGHDEKDFIECDLVLVAAGVPQDSPYLAAARAAGVRCAQSAALFAELSQIPIIGVTGTRGKSTVTHMIHHVLSFVTDETVLLGGNVRGRSNLELLNHVHEDSLCVMELDSWQLQGFGWAGISPQVAVFTNFMDDHLNYYSRGGKNYEEAMDAYFTDKAQIFLHQEDSGVFITTPAVFERAKKLAGTLGQEVVLADASVLPEDMLLSMPGEHNRLNAALAYEALKAVGLSDEEIFDGLATFPGVPGRLELAAEVDGVRIYNDNNATTPTATAAGINAVSKGKNIVLIMGGADKGLDMTALLDAIKESVKGLVLLPGTGTDQFIQTVGDTIPVNWNSVSSLEEAVSIALAEAASGDVVLFSPAFASFGMFNNEYERNDLFMKLVTELEHADD
jgi:UDP-N-acetylmuramoylalanine--D-glutamate ligase